MWKNPFGRLRFFNHTHHLSTSTPGPSHQQQRGCGKEEENQFQSQTTQMSAATAWHKLPNLKLKLVGGFNPSQKYESNWTICPKIGIEHIRIRNHHSENICSSVNQDRNLEIHFFRYWNWPRTVFMTNHPTLDYSSVNTISTMNSIWWFNSLMMDCDSVMPRDVICITKSI